MKYRALSLGVVFLLLGPLSGETFCGYRGEAGKKVERDLDACYSQNVKDTRVRMSTGYELCFGFNHDKLNSTVASFYQRRLATTKNTINNLAKRICEQRDTDLEDYFDFTDTATDESSEDYGLEDGGYRDPQVTTQCKQFFDGVLDSLDAENFMVDAVMRRSDQLISPLFKLTSKKERLFKMVNSIVKRASECSAPMQELRNRLILKYLKQYLVGLVNPPLPSFNAQTLPVLRNPDLFAIRSDDNAPVALDDFPDLSQVGAGAFLDAPPTAKHAPLVAPKRSFEIKARSDAGLSDADRQQILAFDAEQQKLTPQQREDAEQARLTTKDLTPTDLLVMTPGEKYRRNKLSLSDYKKMVDLDDDHSHRGAPVEINRFWDDSLKIKQKRMDARDFDRYRIKGFDIQNSINKLFKE